LSLMMLRFMPANFSSTKFAAGEARAQPDKDVRVSRRSVRERN
jgi:hypothetical protein